MIPAAAAGAGARFAPTLPVLLATLATAGLVHFVTILAYPGEVDDDAYARVAAFAPLGAKAEVPAARRARLPFRDAAMTAAVCRFDLGAGPFRIGVPAFGQGFLSIGFYDRRGRAFSGLNLHEDADNAAVLTVVTADQKGAVEAAAAGADDGRTLPVLAPGRQGFALIEAPADAPDALRAVTCGSA